MLAIVCPHFSGISLLLLSILLASSILCHFAEAYGAMRFGFGGLEQQRRNDIWRPTTEINPQWKLRQWQTVDARDTRGPYKMLRSTRSVDPSEAAVLSDDADALVVPLSPSELTTPQKPVSPATEWAPLFNEEENAEDESAKLLKNLAQNDDEEPLVFSRYNRDCFFTPINCLVGRARQQAANIVGSASNSKRQILFIKRRQHHHKKQKRQRSGNNRHKKSRNIYLL